MGGSLYLCCPGSPLWLHQSIAHRQEALRRGLQSTSGPWTSSSGLTRDRVRNADSCLFPHQQNQQLWGRVLRVTPMPSPKQTLQDKPAPNLQQSSIRGQLTLPHERVTPHPPRGCGPQVTEISMGTPWRTAYLAMPNAQREGTMGLRPLPPYATEPAH